MGFDGLYAPDFFLNFITLQSKPLI